MEEIQHALETADKAVSVAQVQVDKALEKTQREAEDRRREEEKEREDRQQEQEDRRRWIRTILAVAAVALALLEMVDREAAGVLLGLLVSEPPDGILGLLATQLVVVTVAFLIGLAVYFLSDRRGR